MEITGKIIAALEPRSGTSQRTGSAWMTQDFVIETHEQYPKHCVFNVFGEERLKEFNIKVGDELTVSFDIDAHEYQGRWFNNLRAWRVQRVTDAMDANGMSAPSVVAPAPSVAAPAPTAPSTPAAATDTVDDLPF